MSNRVLKKIWQVLVIIGHVLASFFSLAIKAVGTILLIIITTSLILACIAAVYIKNYIQPQLDMNLDDYSLNLSSTIYYQDKETGQWLELKTLYGNENRLWLDYEDIPVYFEKAAVAIEDKRFYDHQGVDWYRTVGAFVNMFLGMRNNFGGSTITQQLIKNLTKEDDVTVSRKILEIFRALDFEKKYSKENIMEWYLNTIYLGEGCNGVATAAQIYFGKDVSECGLAECASIIAITNNPSMYDPYIDKKANKERQELILKEMYDQGIISRDQYLEAVNEELIFKRGETAEVETEVNSWYVDQIIYDVTEDLMEEFNISEVAAEHLIYTAGYKIYACVDMDIQNIVDEVYSTNEYIPYTSSSGKQLQSAITVIDPYTGHVVAMSGGIGKKSGSLLHNRATMSFRQPGSSIKPVAVYAPAINLGLITPGTIMEDSPFSVINGVPYPRNSNGRYVGPVTIYEAVRISLNTIPVKLIDQMSPEVSYDFMVNKLGFTSLVDSYEENGQVFSDISLAPLALGGLTRGVSTLEMAAAYATFPNGGVYYKPKTYTKILDSNDEVVIEKPDTGKTAMKESTAYYINKLLQNVVSSGTGTAAWFKNMSIAGKTGTTDKNNDRWFVGYTPYYVAAVWTGYDVPEYINISSNPAIPMWKAVMQRIHENLEYKAFFTTATGPEIINNLTDATSTEPEEEEEEEPVDPSELPFNPGDETPSPEPSETTEPDTPTLPELPAEPSAGPTEGPSEPVEEPAEPFPTPPSDESPFAG
ncbi:MAG: PBP1A family penicillin-binding protein [Oscillospiraceae bacterium]|jgi:penicillin-binding protein 1A